MPAAPASRLAAAGASAALSIIAPSQGGSFIDLGAPPPERVLLVNGSAAQGLLGRSVACARDLDQDGFVDLLLGAPGLAVGPTPAAGVVYVLRGAPALHTLAAISIDSIAPPLGLAIRSDQIGLGLGASVAGVGDVNDDGAPDIALGAPESTFMLPTSGFATILFGGSSFFDQPAIDLAMLTPVEGFFVQGRAIGNNLGFGVASAGDVNGDSIDDFIVGEPRSEGDGLVVGAGAAAVVFGGKSLMDIVAPAGVLLISLLDGENGFLAQGRAVFGLVGERVAPAGDLNQDGLTDLIISADGEDPPGRNAAGRAYVLFGRADPPDEGRVTLQSALFFSGLVIDGPEPDAITSFSIAGAADLTGDGVDDIVISSPNASPSGVRSGLVHVLFGPRETLEPPIDLAALTQESRALTILGANGDRVIDGRIDTGDVAGFAVAMGDFTGDGVDDLAISSPGANAGENFNAGEVVVIPGSSALATRGVMDLGELGAADVIRIRGQDLTETIGRSLAFADLNGDGFDDLVIGSPNTHIDSRSNAGRAYIVFGFEPLPADLDDDGAVGSRDLALLLAGWGRPDLAADLDGDGAVGAADLALLLQAWENTAP